MNPNKVVIGDSKNMCELDDQAVDLVVTSPPYWNIKNYETTGQIGYGQTIHEYLLNLNQVWKECFRVLKNGTRLCINIGDQFLRSKDYGKYKVVPIHAEIIAQCENLGFDYMGSIIWQKKTTMNTSGGATVMGSYPYPPNGIIEIDYEFILIFKKPGTKKVDRDRKQKSTLTKAEWKEYFSGHWVFGGTTQKGHEAMFPEELPKRLIKMFTFIDDMVLDPFLGSGTTMKATIELGRKCTGYELNPSYLSVIQEKIGAPEDSIFSNHGCEIVRRKEEVSAAELENSDYVPRIQDEQPLLKEDDSTNTITEELFRVTSIVNKGTIELHNGLQVELLGLCDLSPNVFDYLNKFVKGRQVFLRKDPNFDRKGQKLQAYVFLKNKIFVNKEILKMGMASMPSYDFNYKEVFTSIREVANCVSKQNLSG
ncbi:MAG: site-specific DNA-methyltransferase [Gammaproteobacteria bacterium]|nr:site-specific DNA-methyltransferase [Gammaproteobacteria bacterium]MDE0252803.1 site-specific DNA-methyltransferase [Gammaproteobacteria bacterium]MDE0402187.1 site-specific DNA-methyltransferase [Gammaproteobacteria bacterium]